MAIEVRPAQSDALATLLGRCGLRDQQALAELYQLTSAKLFGIAVRILRRDDWAEDVLQESYVNIWTHAGDYAAAKSQPMTWMTSIVRNRALDWLRRPHQEDTSDDYGQMSETLRDDAPTPLEQLGDTFAARALAECMQQLDSRQRQSIALAFQHGLTHAELAAHLRQPLGTIKTWIRRGLEQLKRCLSGTGQR